MLLRIRSNDGVKAWLNGDEIHDHHLGRALDAETDEVIVNLKKGKNPLLIKVDQGSGEWGLALNVVDLDGKSVHGISSSIYLNSPISEKILSAKFASPPVILKTPNGNRQIINAEIFSGGLKELTCTISKDEWKVPQEVKFKNITPGKFTFQIEVPVITQTGPADIQLSSSTDQKKYENVILKKTREWYVYLVQHVHTDIGYTRPQTEILPEHLRFIDTALDYCDLTDDYPDDAKFRWTCEVSWPVREYLKRRPQEQIQRLKKRVKEGRIEITGMFLNMSEIATEDALTASLQPIREFKNNGFPVQTAMQDDVNGIAWGLVDYFSGIGVKYVSMGINKTRSVLPFDKPTTFWWESPSGKRVLAFRGEHYHLGNNWKLHEANLDYFEPRFFEYLNSLEAINYPFDRIAVQYSGYHTDNSPPSTKACDLVKVFNEKYVWPKLRIATVKEFLSYVEDNHADELETYRVAWPDWWTDGFGSAARETAESRRVHTAMKTDQGMLSMAKLLGANIPAKTMERVSAVQDALLFYDEHTFGASESISDPMAENSMVQWGEKSSYVWEAVKKEGLLREEAFGYLQSFLPRSNVPTVAIFNTLNWQKSGLVKIFIDDEILPRENEFRIVNVTTGEEIPVQAIKSRTEGTYWALWAKDIPPLGYDIYRIEKSKNKRVSDTKTDSKKAELENKYYKLKIDSNTGAITSLFDKELGTELVDQNSDWDLGQFIYEKLQTKRDFNREAFERTSLKNVKVANISDGPIWKSLHISADAEGTDEQGGMKIEIRLYKVEKKIELFFQMRKKRIYESEACYVAFPFNMPDGKIVYEAQGGLVTPGKTQLPGSASDWQTVQNFVAVRNNVGQIVFGSSQVPLVQFGDFNLGKWQPVTKIEKPHVYSWVMNNYWFTNFRASQEGEFRWSYYLTSQKGNSNIEAERFATNSNTPLVPRVLLPGKGGNKSAKYSTLKLNASNVVLISARPSYYDDSIILHLREVEGKFATLNLSDKIENVNSIDEVNTIEELIKNDINKIDFEPFEVKFVKLKL
ncbi:MAG: glycosyl hydrolase family 38 [Chlorobi bacterium]|nr:glycosyl hydrolase family 38 [Chlorobiota bacterium]